MSIPVDGSATTDVSTELVRPNDKMNPIIKGWWLAALRDPERKQTKSHLRDEDGECCLGVLCDVAVANGVIPEPERVEFKPVYRFKDDKSLSGWNDAILPRSVREWAGLAIDNPVVTAIVEDYDEESGKLSVRSRVSLAELNDNFGFSFAQLADLIAAQL